MKINLVLYRRGLRKYKQKEQKIHGQREQGGQEQKECKEGWQRGHQEKEKGEICRQGVFNSKVSKTVVNNKKIIVLMSNTLKLTTPLRKNIMYPIIL